MSATQVTTSQQSTSVQPSISMMLTWLNMCAVTRRVSTAAWTVF